MSIANFVASIFSMWNVNRFFLGVFSWMHNEIDMKSKTSSDNIFICTYALTHTHAHARDIWLVKHECSCAAAVADTVKDVYNEMTDNRNNQHITFFSSEVFGSQQMENANSLSKNILLNFHVRNVIFFSSSVQLHFVDMIASFARITLHKRWQMKLKGTDRQQPQKKENEQTSMYFNIFLDLCRNWWRSLVSQSKSKVSSFFEMIISVLCSEQCSAVWGSVCKCYTKLLPKMELIERTRAQVSGRTKA